MTAQATDGSGALKNMEVAHPAEKRPSVAPLVQWGVALLVCIVIVATFHGVVPQVNNLYPQGLPAHVYFQWEHFPLLYVAMPAVVLASVGLMLLPGMVLVLAWSGKRTLGELVLKGFGASLLLHGAMFSVLKLLVQTELQPRAFQLTMFATASLSWLVLLLRWRMATSLPSLSKADHRLLLSILPIPVLAVVLLLPVIFWQDFNPDGLEILTMGRSLNAHVIPRLPTGELSGLGLGMVGAAFPVHWFLVLFGPIEASARLPLILYVPVLFAGIVVLAEWDSPRRLTAVELAILAVQLSAFVTTMCYNVTYHAYSADIASPANIDILAVVLMVATAYSFWSSSRPWFLLFAVLAYLTRPTGLMFLLLLGAGAWLVAPNKLRSRLGILVLAVSVCLLLFIAYERILAPVLGVGIEQEVGGIRSRLRYLRFDDFSRLLFLVVPGGALPALSLFAFKKQDIVARSLTLITAGYFLFFYVLAFIALHHFAPAMLLPIAVFWRLVLRRNQNWMANSLAAALALLALVAAMPRSLEVDRSMRRIGEMTSYQVGNYGGGYAEFRVAFQQKDVLFSLFPPHWKAADPAKERLGEPWVQVHYASRSTSRDRHINYLVQEAVNPAPSGFAKVASTAVAVLYVKDLQRWQRDRDKPPPTDFRSPLYAIPRETLFRSAGVQAKNYSVDLKEVAKRLRAILGHEGPR